MFFLFYCSIYFILLRIKSRLNTEQITVRSVSKSVGRLRTSLADPTACLWPALAHSSDKLIIYDLCAYILTYMSTDDVIILQVVT